MTTRLTPDPATVERLREIVVAARSGCAHANIAESRRYPDGSVDGRCVDCGEDGFAIVDKSWESFRSAEPLCCGTSFAGGMSSDGVWAPLLAEPSNDD